MEKQYKPIPALNDHPNCKGHQNFVLDCTYETQDQRNLLIRCIDNYITEE